MYKSIKIFIFHCREEVIRLISIYRDTKLSKLDFQLCQLRVVFILVKHSVNNKDKIIIGLIKLSFKVLLRAAFQLLKGLLNPIAFNYIQLYPFN